VALLCLALLSIALASVSCGPKPEVRRYTLHGKIQSVDLPNKTANIYNEKIEGWMDAMTMEYSLPEGAKLRAGDPITATIVVTDTNYRLENIKSP